MKLAEALQLRADLNRQISELRRRISFNVTVQEGEEPAEEPMVLLRELTENIDKLQELIKEINLVNCRTIVEGKSLTEWIARKDCLMLKLSALRDVVAQASNITGRYSRSEIKILPTIKVKDVQKEVDSLSADLRKVDNLIQQANWTTEM